MTYLWGCLCLSSWGTLEGIPRASVPLHLGSILLATLWDTGLNGLDQISSFTLQGPSFVLKYERGRRDPQLLPLLGVGKPSSHLQISVPSKSLYSLPVMEGLSNGH